MNNLDDFLLNTNWCALPYCHMNIETNGDCKPCCRAKPILDNDGTPLNIKNYTIDELWNHPKRLEFVEKFNRNEKPSECDQCFVREPIPANQQRVKFSKNRRARDYAEKYLRGDKQLKLNWIEIRPGNICNLKCRICGPEFSSQWAKDANEATETVPFKESPWYTYNKNCQWIEHDNVFDSVDSLKDVKHIHFLGGEPLMVPQHFDLLKNILDKTSGKDIEIYYNTNGTKIFTKEQLEILKQFKSITINLSIDDIEKRFEYQRKNAKWSEVYENIKWFFKMREESKPLFYVYFAHAISILNIYDIDEYYNLLQHHGIQLPYPEHWVTTPGLDIRSFTPTEKEFVKAKLEKGTHPYTKIVLDRMMAEDIWSEQHQLNRYSRIKKLDLIRNESFSDVYPELSKILNIEHK